MTPDQFKTLAEAYGGDLARWPHELREAAAGLVAADPSLAISVLAPASELDAALDAWRPMGVSHDLRERVIDQAPRAGRRAPVIGWLWGAGVGAGLAAACAAGLVVGAAFVGAPLPDESVSAALTGYEDFSTSLMAEGA